MNNRNKTVRDAQIFFKLPQAREVDGKLDNAFSAAKENLVRSVKPSNVIMNFTVIASPASWICAFRPTHF